MNLVLFLILVVLRGTLRTAPVPVGKDQMLAPGDVIKLGGCLVLVEIEALEVVHQMRLASTPHHRSKGE